MNRLGSVELSQLDNMFVVKVLKNGILPKRDYRVCCMIDELKKF